MYVRIHSDKDYNNTGSCSALVDYLEKENSESIAMENGHEYWFNQDSTIISSFEVQNSLDSNHAKLAKNEAKFYMISINPSERELKHICNKVAGREIKSIKELTNDELEEFSHKLKDYARDVMKSYADNFYRINTDTGERVTLTEKDILYFGKVEHQRHYDRTSKEVVEGIKKAGELKEGLQSHVHIVVSRMDTSKKIRLSPLSNARAATTKLNGQSVKVGFTRKEFYLSAEKNFDQKFSYSRSYSHSFLFRNTRKNDMRKISNMLISRTTGIPTSEKALQSKVINKIANQIDPIKELRAVFDSPIGKDAFKLIAGSYDPVQLGLKVAIKVAKKVAEVVSKSTL